MWRKEMGILGMRHQTISFLKSGLRIAGYLAVGGTLVALLALAPDAVIHLCWFGGWGLLVISEIVGILEEVGQD